MFEFYKREQGKWTRLLTMAGGGAVALLGAVWLAQAPLTRIMNAFGAGAQAKLIAEFVGGSVFFLAVAYLTFWISYLRPGTGDFLIAVEGEMKKVSWSSRKDIIGSTQVVIFTLAFMGVLLFVVDLAFMLFFQLIGVLRITGVKQLLGSGGGG